MSAAKRILVVEDNEQNRLLVAEVLDLAGYGWVAACDAEEGLAIARTHAVDLVIMDIQLPGMDGLTATRHLKRDPATRHLPVLALTALAFEEDRQRAFAAGVDAFVTKPFVIAALLAKLEGLLLLGVSG